MTRNVAFIGFNDLHECHKGFAESIDADIIEMDGFSNSSFRHLRNGFLYLYYAAKLRKYDYMVCEESFSMRSGYLAKKFFGSNLIRLIADEDYIYLKDGRMESKSLVRMSKEVDGAIAVSKLAKESAKKFIKSKIEIAYPYITQSMKKLIDREKGSEEEKIILSVGYNRPNKGFDRLVSAFNELKEKFDYRLVIVGKGNPQKYGDLEGIDTPGFVSQKELAEYYNSADIYVQPSYGDTFPVTVIEAMYAGLPVIISDRVGQREIVPDKNIFSDEAELKSKLGMFLNGEESFDQYEKHSYEEIERKKMFREAFNKVIGH